MTQTRTNPNPTKIAYEQRYSDDSGVEFGISYDENKIGDEIEIKHILEVTWPKSKLEWLIEHLQDIVYKTRPPRS